MALEFFARGPSVFVWDPETRHERRWRAETGWSDSSDVSKFLILGEGDLNDLAGADARRILGADLDHWLDEPFSSNLNNADGEWSAVGLTDVERRLPGLSRLGCAAKREAVALGF